MDITPEAMRECIRENVYDPELGLNVVDLGLLYDLAITDKQAHVEMTLTTMGCPLYDVIQADITRALQEQFGQELQVEVEFVFDPPWTPEMMSEDARMEMGFV